MINVARSSNNFNQDVADYAIGTKEDLPAIRSFTFNKKQCRAFFDKSTNVAYVCLSDLLRAVGSINTANKVIPELSEMFGDENKIVVPLQDSLGKSQETNFVSEHAALFIVSSNRTAVSKRVHRWLFSEVLPTIRQTGAYIAGKGAMDGEMVSATSESHKALPGHAKLIFSKFADPYLQLAYEMKVRHEYSNDERYFSTEDIINTLCDVKDRRGLIEDLLNKTGAFEDLPTILIGEPAYRAVSRSDLPRFLSDLPGENALNLKESIVEGMEREISRKKFIESRENEWMEQGQLFEMTRKALNLRRFFVSQEVGVSESTIRKFETGKPIMNSTLIQNSYSMLLELRALRMSPAECFNCIEELNNLVGSIQNKYLTYQQKIARIQFEMEKIDMEFHEDEDDALCTSAIDSFWMKADRYKELLSCTIRILDLIDIAHKKAMLHLRNAIPSSLTNVF